MKYREKVISIAAMAVLTTSVVGCERPMAAQTQQPQPERTAPEVNRGPEDVGEEEGVESNERNEGAEGGEAVQEAKSEAPDRWEGIVLGEALPDEWPARGVFFEAPVQVAPTLGPDGKVTHIEMGIIDWAGWHDSDEEWDRRYEEILEALRSELGEPGGLEPWNERFRPEEWISESSVETQRAQRESFRTGMGPTYQPVRVWRGDGHRLILAQYMGLEVGTYGLKALIQTEDPGRTCGSEDGVDRFVERWNQTLEQEDFEALAEMIEYPFTDGYSLIQGRAKGEGFNPQTREEFIAGAAKALESGLLQRFDLSEGGSCRPKEGYVLGDSTGVEFMIPRTAGGWRVSGTTMSMP